MSIKLAHVVATFLQTSITWVNEHLPKEDARELDEHAQEEHLGVGAAHFLSQEGERHAM